MKKTFALLCFLCAFIMNATAQTWVGTSGYSSTGCREEQSVIQQYTPLHQTSGEGIIGRRGDTTETEQHLQF